MNLIKKISAKSPAILAGLGGLLGTATLAYADITNPVIGNLGADATKAASGATFVNYFVLLWRALINIGAIMVLVYFAWGALDWITAAGDKGKLETARNKITNSIIGIIILVSSFTLIGFISNLFFGSDFNILKLTFPNATTTTGLPAVSPTP
jgi:hypothetical protein